MRTSLKTEWIWTMLIKELFRNNRKEINLRSKCRNVWCIVTRNRWAESNQSWRFLILLRLFSHWPKKESLTVLSRWVSKTCKDLISIKQLAITPNQMLPQCQVAVRKNKLPKLTYPTMNTWLERNICRNRRTTAKSSQWFPNAKVSNSTLRANKLRIIHQQLWKCSSIFELAMNWFDSSENMFKI